MSIQELQTGESQAAMPQSAAVEEGTVESKGTKKNNKSIKKVLRCTAFRVSAGKFSTFPECSLAKDSRRSKM